MKSAGRLRPEDFGFVRHQPADRPGPFERPYYERIYVSRRATRIPSAGVAPAGPPFGEETLVNYLRIGEHLLLIGQPYDGKTRTMFERVRRLEGFEVLKPPAVGVVSLNALSFYKGKRVMLLFDDLGEFRSIGSKEFVASKCLTRLAQGVLDGLRMSGNYREQNPRRAIGPGPPLLPVAQSGWLETEFRGEGRLA